MKTHHLLLIVVIAALLGLAGCGGNKSNSSDGGPGEGCQAGDKRTCICPQYGIGTQFCKDDSSGWAPCLCGDLDASADADVDGDADTDADTDGDGDGDMDADSGPDGNPDGGDGDADGDTDTDTDTDSDTDTDADADGDADASQYLFFENFENGNLDGWFQAVDGGLGDGGIYSVREITGDTAANGTAHSFHIVGGNGTQSFNGLVHLLDQLEPSEISFWARSGAKDKRDTYFAVSGSATPSATNAILWLAFNNNGYIMINQKVTPFQVAEYDAGVWYHLEIRNIDWLHQTFEVWLDGVMISDKVAFRGDNVSSAMRLDLFNYDSSEAWWDEIIFQ